MPEGPGRDTDMDTSKTKLRDEVAGLLPNASLAALQAILHVLNRESSSESNAPPSPEIPQSQAPVQTR